MAASPGIHPITPLPHHPTVKPQITDLDTWNKAELLLQPAFIRLLDNFRKALAELDWESRYDDIATWPKEVSEAQKAQYEELIEKLEQAKPSEVQEIEELLAQIPEPQMAYELCLSRGDRQVRFDMWQLCYQVCFQNYNDMLQGEAQPVVIDEGLLTEEEEVDWPGLDRKVEGLVKQIIDAL